MRTTQRILALAGMTLVAGATIGMSASSAYAAGTNTENATQIAPHHPGGGDGDHHGGGDGDHHGGPFGGPFGGGFGGGGDHRWHGGWDWRNHDHTRTAGFFRSYRACEIAGTIGERRGAWEQFYCDQVGGRTVALEVENGWWRR